MPIFEPLDNWLEIMAFVLVSASESKLSGRSIGAAIGEAALQKQ